MMDPEWHHVVIYNNDWPAAEEWCQQHIGEFDQDWYKLGIDAADWFRDGPICTRWYFKKEKDAIIFSLKWT